MESAKCVLAHFVLIMSMKSVVVLYYYYYYFLSFTEEKLRLREVQKLASRLLGS